MGKISLRVYGEEFIDFVQKNKNTFHQEDGKMRLIRRDKRWYLEDSKKEPLAFSDLNEDLSPRKVTWKVKGDDSNQFIDTSIVIKIWGKKVVRAFGKSMKQEAPKVQPSTEPRTRNLKRSLRELDANSPVKRRKGNNHDPFCFTAFSEKYHDDEYYMMRLQDDMYREAKTTEEFRLKTPSEYYPKASYLEEQEFDEDARLDALLDVIGTCFQIGVQKHTFHLAIRLFDRYASTYAMRESHLKVLPWAAFSIAVKYIEVETVSMQAYSRWGLKEEHVIHLERQLFQAVEYRVDDLLPYHFAERFFLMVVTEIEKQKSRTAAKFHCLLWYLLDLSIIEYKLLPYASVPSHIAAACVCLACTITQELDWPNNQKRILEILGCTTQDVFPIVEIMKETIKNGDLPRKSGLLKRYSTEENYKISSRLAKFFGKPKKKGVRKESKD